MGAAAAGAGGGADGGRTGTPGPTAQGPLLLFDFLRKPLESNVSVKDCNLVSKFWSEYTPSSSKLSANKLLSFTLAHTFKEIIFSYRKQSQCKPQVFRSVYVNWPSRSRSGKIGEDHVDIITFYNEVFIPIYSYNQAFVGGSWAWYQSEQKQ